MAKIVVNQTDYEIVVIGMGYVGLTYSLHLNTFGYSVFGVKLMKKQKIKLIVEFYHFLRRN